MTNKHTKGEWITNEGQIYPQETGKTLALIPYFNKDDEEQEANAKLIAAAPNMLKIIEDIAAKLSEHQKVDSKIMAGYTLAANIEGLTEIANEITSVLSKIKF